MTATISYDRPVRNLIDALSATGHVTHASYKKTSVTLHHNAGIFTHDQVLNIWKSRPASAHFDVDAQGAVAQYVAVNEYAWAVGNTAGNQSSISIEMCNSTLVPDWKVSDTTWQSAARLAGWLFAKVIKARPSSSNFFYHHHWYATSCAGPYMDKIYNQVLAAAQKAYDGFVATPSPTPTPTPTPPTSPYTKDTVIAIQGLVEATRDGKWGPGTDNRAMTLRAGATGRPCDVKLLQSIVNVAQDGVFGPLTRTGVRLHVVALQKILKVSADGVWGPNTDKAFITCRNQFLNKF